MKKFEEIEIHLVELFCDKDKISVDIGTTGSGPYTEEMIQYSKKVYSYEPHPISAEYMRKKFGDRIKFNEYAVTNKVGNAVLSTPLRETVLPDQTPGKRALSSVYIDFKENGNEAERYSIKTITLDSENLPPVSLIKIDVEGSEIEVLEGAQNTIKTSRPFIIIEMDEQHRSGTLQSNNTFFESIDYTGFYIENKLIYPIIKFIDSGRKNNSLEVNCGNIYNFIFIPNEKISIIDLIRIKLNNL